MTIPTRLLAPGVGLVNAPARQRLKVSRVTVKSSASLASESPESSRIRVVIAEIEASAGIGPRGATRASSAAAAGGSIAPAATSFDATVGGAGPLTIDVRKSIMG